MEGDSLKALPTSRVAGALRRYQELAVLTDGDPSRTHQTVEELLEKTRLLPKRLDAQRAAKRQKGTP